MHGDKYIYHKTKVVKVKEKTWFECRNGHCFEQRPQNHKNGHGCSECGGSKKMTKEEFIEKANKVHGVGRYDYSEVDYKGSKIDVWIICHEHDEPYRFPQTPNAHLSGEGCLLCGIKSAHEKRKLTLKEFIKESNEIHGEGRYDYSKVKYINYNTTVLIICHKHDESYEFWQSPSDHLDGHGCKLCGIKSAHEKTKMTLEEFINESNKIHGEGRYDYSKVNYINNSTEVIIICPNHDIPYEFKQKPNEHLQGHGCKICGNIQCHEKQKLTLEEFIEQANEVQGIGRYDYSKVKYVNNKTEVIIICPNYKEPYEFPQKPNNHLNGEGCPLCRSRASKGESDIRNWLINNDIEFEQQKRFDDCRNINTLPFDFYLPQYNLCIEFDGEQHFIPKAFKSKVTYDEKLENLKSIQFRDGIKTDYCKNNNINFLRIKYTENVEEKLAEYFQSHKSQKN